MPEIKQGVIFDLDGVIVDSAVFHYRAWKKLADELGISFNEQANEKLRGIPRRESLLALMGFNPGEDKILEYMDRKNTYYLEMVETIKTGDMLPGVDNLLVELKSGGFKLALASSSKNARLVLGKLGITTVFDAIVDGNETTKGKPDPELFLKAAHELGVLPSSCLVVEDAESGIAAGIAAGMHTIGVGNPQALARAECIVSRTAQIDSAMVIKVLSGDSHSGSDAG
ncbi:beta-phosphoglucomutase [bacterium]|nr:beta-phosphoglucomutase [bacterium]